MELLTLLLLIGLGLAFIVVEVYVIPGFNVVGAAGFLLIAFAVAFAFYTHGFTGGVFTLIGAMGALGSVLYGLWQSGAWDRFVLADSLRRDPDESQMMETRRRFLGKEGVTLTPLRPGGVVQIGEERVEASTEGEFIASGSRVRVVALDRLRYFVRLADGEPAAGARRASAG